MDARQKYMSLHILGPTLSFQESEAYVPVKLRQLLLCVWFYQICKHIQDSHCLVNQQLSDKMQVALTHTLLSNMWDVIFFFFVLTGYLYFYEVSVHFQCPLFDWGVSLLGVLYGCQISVLCPTAVLPFFKVFQLKKSGFLLKFSDFKLQQVSSNKSQLK